MQTTETNVACYICGSGSTRRTEDFARELKLVDCPTCGKYEMDTELHADMSQKPLKDESWGHLIVAEIRNAGQRILVDEAMIDRARKGVIREKTVAEKMDLVLRHFARQSREAGQEVRLGASDWYPFAYCRSAKEWVYLVLELEKLHLLRKNHLTQGLASTTVTVTHEGWEEVTRRRGGPTGKAFVAMSFSGHLDPLKAAISRAVELAGYRALRVDEEPFTGSIVDKILAHIRESQFVVSDFTENKGGVYYEAGFARGLGIPVIHTCREDHLDPKSPDRLHFDIAHMVAVPWKDGDLPAFTEALRLRIEAIFGKGPHQPAS